VPFYRARALGERTFTSLDRLRDYPILTKDDVKAAGRALVSQRTSGSLVEIHTGGTTGKPLTIFCDRHTLQLSYAFFGRLREWAGIPNRGRVATFAGRRVVPAAAGAPFWRHNLSARTLLFSSYHISPATVDQYLEALGRFKPDLIDSYPSSLHPLATRMLERNVSSIRPRGIVTSSETLFAEVRRDLEAAFGCRVTDYYGAAEMAAFVGQCEKGRYHVNPEYGVVEVLRDGEPVRPGESGEIVATGFINPVMPLIRYATGDLAVMAEPGCECGRHFPVLDRVEGRMDDVIVTPDGRRVGRLDPIFKAVSSLFETQIVQDRPDHVRVEVVVRGPFPQSEERVLLEELRARLGNRMTIDIERVSVIERTGRGKLRTVVNLVESRRTTSARGNEG
jgi:phenylacetate-CoA ligase